MSQIETVTQVNDPNFKVITSKKNGKQYTLAQITTDQNHVAEIFAPINVGDKVQIEWDASYGVWKANKVNAKAQEQMDAIRKVYELNLAIYKAITKQDYQPKVAPVAPVSEPDVPVIDVDEPIDLNSIPF